MDATGLEGFPTAEGLHARIEKLHRLIDEWSLLQHALIDKATAARIEIQVLMKELQTAQREKP